MMLRRSLQAAVVVSGALGPAAFAQNGGSVTVAPLGAAVPALGGPALGVVAVLLAVAAAVVLRRSHRTAATLLVVVAVTMTAAIGYSTAANLTISGAECREVTQKSYDSFGHLNLESQCPNPIRVIALELTCKEDPSETLIEPLPVQRCEVGVILAPGEECHLPSCVC